MDNLVLRPGPLLMWRDLHREESGHLADRDVGERAVEFLFEPVTLEAGLTLGDVFRLLDQCPPLQHVFRREFASDLCAEARKGPLAPSLGHEPDAGADIEYLELRWSWRLDTGSNLYSEVHRLEVHGVGRVLAADAPEQGVKAGERILWSVSLTPLRELLNLPLRLRDDFEVQEDDPDAKAYGQSIGRGKCREVLLGQVIHGLLWELSWHGGPETQAAFLEDLLARVAEVDAGTERLIPAAEVFAESGSAGFDVLFESTGGIAHGDVRRALRTIDDHLPVGPWMDQEFAGRVVIRAPYRDRPAREFRRALRAAGR